MICWIFLRRFEKLEHWTSPPPRYNEASLVKSLEEQGIGRPSTYASIISNIQDRGYVQKEQNRFMPTELGMVVCKMLVESFPEVMDVQFTAKVEEQLDKIEEGEIRWRGFLKNFWKSFEVALEKAKDEMKNLKKQQIPTGINCKKCDEGEYHIKWGRNGQFLACSSYPECNSTHDFKKDFEGVIHILPKIISMKIVQSVMPGLRLKQVNMVSLFDVKSIQNVKRLYHSLSI